MSKTGKMWAARLAKGARRVTYHHDALHRLKRRGVVALVTERHKATKSSPAVVLCTAHLLASESNQQAIPGVP